MEKVKSFSIKIVDYGKDVLSVVFYDINNINITEMQYYSPTRNELLNYASSSLIFIKDNPTMFENMYKDLFT